MYLTETISHLRSKEAQERWLGRVTARKRPNRKKMVMAFYLLVVNADADVTAKLPVVPTLEFNRFLWVFLTAGYWARQGRGSRPLMNIISAKNSVSLHNFVVMFNTNITESLFTILAAMFGL